jgi:hypothetical protein
MSKNNNVCLYFNGAAYQMALLLKDCRVVGDVLYVSGVDVYSTRPKRQIQTKISIWDKCSPKTTRNPIKSIERLGIPFQIVSLYPTENGIRYYSGLLTCNDPIDLCMLRYYFETELREIRLCEPDQRSVEKRLLDDLLRGVKLSKKELAQIYK